MTLHNAFTVAARATARATGHPLAFALAGGLVVLWLVSGPVFGFSDTWQLVINTGTTIITFLMVFLIQHTQNRDTDAVHIKLDEIIRSIRGAHNAIVSLEDLDDRELEVFRKRYAAIAEAARRKARQGQHDTGVPDVLAIDAAVAAEAEPGSGDSR